MKRLPPRRRNAPELISPDELLQTKAPLIEPADLFKSVTARPSYVEETRQEVIQQGMRQPGELFGPLQIATPGQSLRSPQALDLLPGLPLKNLLLEPLPKPEDIFKNLALEQESELPAENTTDGIQPPETQVTSTVTPAESPANAPSLRYKKRPGSSSPASDRQHPFDNQSSTR